jgi:hypothetical protein
MVTKGIIKNIDYNSNTCTVRLPLFETASQATEVAIPAVFSVTPGITNSYAENDIVIVAFDNNSISSPVILGKLYLGNTEESKNFRGSIKCDSLTVANEASLPITTKLVYQGADESLVKVEKGITSYSSIADIIKKLQHTEQTILEANLDSLDNQIAEIKTFYIKTSDNYNPPAVDAEE